MRKLYFLFIILSISACGKQIHQNRPLENYPSQSIVAQSSTLSLPIKIPVKVLEKQVNKEVSALLYESQDLDIGNGKPLSIKIFRTKEVKLSTEEASLIIETPLKIKVKGNYKASILGLSVNTKLDQDLAMDIVLATRLSFGKDWKILSKTSLRSYTWTEKPKVRVGPLHVGISGWVDDWIKQEEATITKQIDEALSQKLDFRPQIEAAWANFQEVFDVYDWDGDKVWFWLVPEQLKNTAILPKGNYLLSFVEVRAKTQGFMGKKPIVTKKSLPEVRLVESITPQLDMTILGKVSKALALKKARKIFVGEEYPIRGKKQKVKVQSLDIYASEGRMVLVLDLAGSIEGKIYVLGKPEYNSKLDKLEIKNLDYTADAKLSISKFTKWLFDKKIKKAIKSSIEDPINEQIQGMKAEVEKSLSHYPLQENTLLKGNMEKFYINKVELVQEGFILEFILKAQAEVLLSGF